MEGMCFNSKKLIKLLIPQTSDTTEIEDMTAMFYGCISVINLNVSKLAAISVKDMNSMFDSCESLCTLDISNCDTSSLKCIKEMFNDCRSLKTLSAKNCFNTALFSNKMENCDLFKGCYNLAKVIADEEVKNILTTFLEQKKGHKILKKCYIFNVWILRI